MQGLSFKACGIFPNQGSNPCLLHWQADSLSLSQPPGKTPPGEFLLSCFCFVDTLGIVPSYNKGALLFGEVSHN